MKKLLISFAVLSLWGMPAFANGDTCEKLQDNVWSCPIPTGPSGPTKCHIYGDSLICNKEPVFAEPAPKPPENCGWSRKVNRYVCW